MRLGIEGFIFVGPYIQTEKIILHIAHSVLRIHVGGNPPYWRVYGL